MTLRSKIYAEKYSLLEVKGNDCWGLFCSYGVNRISFSIFYLALIFLYYLAPLVLAFWTKPSKKLMSSSKLTWFDFLRAALYLASFLDSLNKETCTQTSLIRWNESTGNVSVKQKLNIGMTGKSICRAELDNGIDDPVFCFRILQVKVKTFIHDFIKFLESFCISGVEAGPNFAQDPNCHSNYKISRNVLV